MKTHTTRTDGWGGRRAAGHVLGVLAVAGALIGSMARPAAAGDLSMAQLFTTPQIATLVQSSNTLGVPSTPLRMDFFRLDCINEQDDGFFDLHSEPYLVVFAADLSGAVTRATTVRSQIFGSVDDHETHYANPVMQVWDFDGTGSPILDPNKLIFLCALMESDDSSSRADAVRTRVQSDLFAKLLAYRAGGLSRDAIVSNLTTDMNVAINASRGGDDRIGGVRELRLTLTDVERARRGTEPQVIKTLTHVESGAEYWTSFVLQTTILVIN